MLGEGGMGEVYRARDTKLGREVALKMLPAEMAVDPERLERFEREAQAVAALNHPNIVTVHSIEQDGDVRFITMELVEGKPLEELVPAGGFDLDAFFAVAVPLADALAAAHGKGITHRDLKPANVMVTDEGRAVKILDFGLAKFQVAEAGASTDSEAATVGMTRAGAVMGTVPYMSPEQIEGRALDHRTDIFSLGVVLHEMLAGERPFRGDSSAAVTSSILRDVPRLVTESRIELPRHLGRIVKRCLEKDPERRYQSALDVRNELEDLEKEVGSAVAQASQTLASAAHGDLAVEPSRPGSATGAAGRFRWARWMIGAAAVSLLGLGVWWSSSARDGDRSGWRGRQALETRSEAGDGRQLIAVLPLRNLGAPEDEFFAAGITEEIITKLATLPGLALVSTANAAASDFELSPSDVGRRLGVDFVLAGSIQWARGGDGGASRVKIRPRLIRVADNVHLWAEGYDRTIEQIFELQAEIAVQVARELGAALGEMDRERFERPPTMNQEAYELYLRGRFAHQATDCGLARANIPILERALELDPAFMEAWALLSRGYAAAVSHCPEHADADGAASRRALERAAALAPASWEVQVARAQYFTQVERDYPLALEALERAAEQITSFEIYFSQGRIYRRQGRWPEALAAFRRATEADPLEPGAIARLAFTHLWMRNYAEAIELSRRTSEISSTFDSPYYRSALAYWLWKGETEQAREVLELMGEDSLLPAAQWYWFWQRVYEQRFEEALAGLARMPDEPAYVVDLHATSTSSLEAWVHELSGERDLARAAWRRARADLEGAVAEFPTDANFRSALAIVYAGLGLADEAVAEAERAMALMPIDRDPYWGQSPLKEAALVYTMIGEHERAFDALDTLLGMSAPVSIPWLELDPRWEPLWGLPRFRELGSNHAPQRGEEPR